MYINVSFLFIWAFVPSVPWFQVSVTAQWPLHAVFYLDFSEFSFKRAGPSLLKPSSSQDPRTAGFLSKSPLWLTFSAGHCMVAISALAHLQAGIPAVADLTTSTCRWFLVWTPRAKHAMETRGPGLTTSVSQNQHVVSSPSSSSQEMAVPCGWLLTAASFSYLRSFYLDPKPHVQLMAEMANCGKYG